ncbi:FAD-dependent oxidoreductase [Glycomyces sp. L485]|uniref:NAD(P)/FAD-dependent oxidoreductase n=1 Tax=Glycomyces sp. L485 TaxID=2909235 RepID=UPI001F4A32C6|nr:FAD-dependent oxidoreductase [Glycomyces sp. L485]MCH7230270.1 FAD-dependent oxidoreductase [Glycomyces sp. L485]
MAEAPFVIVGGGLAAAHAAKTLREEGYERDLVVVTAEPHRPYERPPLSKDYLRGEAERTALFPVEDGWYADNSVDVRVGIGAVGLDPAAHRLALADGAILDYSKLLLATGSEPRPLSLPGSDLQGVLTLRTVDGADLLAATLRASARDGSGRIAVVGDGWIGMEVAASARDLGAEVTVLGGGEQPLRVLGPRMGELFAQLHVEHGVELRRGAEATEFIGSQGQVTAVKTADGATVEADAVLVAVGAVPNTGLAAAGGLTLRAPELGGGVAVDVALRTSDPDVFAAGDIASIPSPHYGRPLRVEHWETALHTGPHAAKAMLGSDEPYDRLPYFFTDQYDLGMEYLGFVAEPDSADALVVSGSLDDREFVAFWTDEGRVVAGMAVNTWDRMPEVEELIRSRRDVPRGELEAFRG